MRQSTNLQDMEISSNNILIMKMEGNKKSNIEKDILEKMKKSEKEIENGEGIESEEAFKELRQKYGY